MFSLPLSCQSSDLRERDYVHSVPFPLPHLLAWLFSPPQSGFCLNHKMALATKSPKSWLELGSAALIFLGFFKQPALLTEPLFQNPSSWLLTIHPRASSLHKDSPFSSSFLASLSFPCSLCIRVTWDPVLCPLPSRTLLPTHNALLPPLAGDSLSHHHLAYSSLLKRSLSSGSWLSVSGCLGSSSTAWIIYSVSVFFPRHWKGLHKAPCLQNCAHLMHPHSCVGGIVANSELIISPRSVQILSPVEWSMVHTGIPGLMCHLSIFFSSQSFLSTPTLNSILSQTEFLNHSMKMQCYFKPPA